MFVFWIVGGKKPNSPAPPVYSHQDIGCWADLGAGWISRLFTKSYTDLARVEANKNSMTVGLCSEICAVRANFNK